MILLAQDRKDNLHLVDYTNNGRKWTLCGLVYLRKDIINTLAVDDTPHNICKKCQEEYENLYTSQLDSSIRSAKSASQHHLMSHMASLMTARHPSSKFWYLPERHSDAISRFRRKLSRK
jgi:hypothetical protein